MLDTRTRSFCKCRRRLRSDSLHRPTSGSWSRDCRIVPGHGAYTQLPYHWVTAGHGPRSEATHCPRGLNRGSRCTSTFSNTDTTQGVAIVPIVTAAIGVFGARIADWVSPLPAPVLVTYPARFCGGSRARRSSFGHIREISGNWTFQPLTWPNTGLHFTTSRM